jgi:hypothetical protein
MRNVATDHKKFCRIASTKINTGVANNSLFMLLPIYVVIYHFLIGYSRFDIDDMASNRVKRTYCLHF